MGKQKLHFILSVLTGTDYAPLQSTHTKTHSWWCANRLRYYSMYSAVQYEAIVVKCQLWKLALYSFSWTCTFLMLQRLSTFNNARLYVFRRETWEVKFNSNAISLSQKLIGARKSNISARGAKTSSSQHALVWQADFYIPFVKAGMQCAIFQLSPMNDD